MENTGEIIAFCAGILVSAAFEWIKRLLQKPSFATWQDDQVEINALRREVLSLQHALQLEQTKHTLALTKADNRALQQALEEKQAQLEQYKAYVENAALQHKGY